MKTVMDELLQEWEYDLSRLAFQQAKSCSCGHQGIHTKPSSQRSRYRRPSVAREFEYENEYESLFRVSDYPAAITSLLAKGQENNAIQTAITGGITDEDKLSSLVFHVRHPERGGRGLKDKSEPNFQLLANEWLDIRDGLVRPWLGRSAARVRRYSCSNANIAEISNYAGRPVTADEIKGAMEEAVKNGVFWAMRAAHALKTSPRSSNTRELFGQAFGTCPEHLPREWASKSRNWKDFGELAAIRLLAAAKLLRENWIRYFCSCQPFNAPTICTPDVWGCSTTGKICVSGSFWRAWRNGDKANTGITMVHEALHLYFEFMQHSGLIANINCYELFVLKFNNLPVTEDTLDFCASKAGACITG